MVQKMVQWSPEWKHHFLPSAGGVVQHPLYSRQEGQEDKYSRNQDSVSKMGESKGIYDEVPSRGYFNPELTKWGSLCYLSQWMLPGRFKFSLIESKVTTLRDVWRRAKDFIQAIEICIGDDFVWQNVLKRVVEDDNL